MNSIIKKLDELNKPAQPLVWPLVGAKPKHPPARVRASGTGWSSYSYSSSRFTERQSRSMKILS